MDPDNVGIPITTHAPLSTTPAPEPQPEPAVENAPPKSPEPLDDVASEKTEQKQEAEDPSGGAKKNTCKDDGDDVVREFEVYFKANLDRDSQLYVMQYLDRPRRQPYDLDHRCEEVRLMRGTGKIEIDLSCDPHSKNCDQEFANMPEMEQQTLTTEWNSGSSTDHAIAVLVGNKLHLNAVNAIVQLQPSKDHLKHDSSKRKRKASDTGEETSFSTIKNQDKHAALSTEYKEIWVPLQYHGSESEFSAKYLKRMGAQDSSRTKRRIRLNDYVGPRPSYKRVILDLPLEERIKELFVKDPVGHRFSDLKKYCIHQNEEKELLDVLQKNGLLLRNLWIPKTELLYPIEEYSFRKKDVDEHLCTARNYILYSLWKNPVIGLPELDLYRPIKSDCIRMLKPLVLYRVSTRDWKMREWSDVSFAELYPEIYKSQEQLWERMGKQLVRALKPYRVGPITISDKTRALTEAVKTVFRSQPVCNLEFILNGLVSSNKSFDASPEKLQDVLEDIADEIGDVYVMKSALKEGRKYCQFRDIVIELLRENKGPLSKNDIVIPAEMKLGRTIETCEYNAVMSELCERTGGQSYLRSGDGISTR